MATIELKNQTGEVLSNLELADSVFAITPHEQAVYSAVLSGQAHKRQGTHDTLNRTEVRGGGRKPYRQKGTGRARQGSTRAPQFRHGGIVFGPTPHKYNVGVNKKVVDLAYKSVLSSYLADGKLIVVDKIALESEKTKGFVEVLKALGVNEKKVIIATTDIYDNALITAANNVPNAYVQAPSHLSVYDLLTAQCIVATEEAIKEFEEDLK